MDGLRRIVFFLIFLFLCVRFFIFPAIRIIVNLVKLGNLKKQMESLGKEIQKVKAGRKSAKTISVLEVILFFYFVILAVLQKEPWILLLCLLLIPNWMDLLLFSKYSEYDGFYENGIVRGTFVKWGDIFSWKKIDGDKLSFLKQDGLRFDMGTNSNQSRVVDFMVSKGIPEEK